MVKIAVVIVGGNCTAVFSDGTPVEVEVLDQDNALADTGELLTVDRGLYPLEVY